MRDELIITGLRIDRMYGHRLDLGVDDLGSTVNILYGPNGSGKTTLARALESVLWPSTAASDGRVIDVSMMIGGEPWSASLDRGRTVWRKDGREASPPPLPPDDQRDRYQLLLPELIAAEDENFARLVLREMVGGVDVQAAAESLGFRVPSPRRGSATEAAETSAGKVADLARKRGELKTDRDRLAGLEKELEEAVSARHAVEYLKDLVAALDMRDARIQAAVRLQEFPSEMADLQGDEPDQLDDLRTGRDGSAQKLKEAHDSITEHLAALNAIRLDGPVPNADLVELDARVRKIEQAEADVRLAEAALRAATEEEMQAWASLGIGLDRNQAATLDLPGFETLSGVVRQKRSVEAREEARRQLIELIGQPEAGPKDTDELTAAARHLVNWMQTAEDASGVPATRRHLLIALGLVHVAVGLWIGASYSEFGFVLVPAGIAAAWLAWQVPTVGSSSDAATYRRGFEQTGLEAPSSWTRQDVWLVLDQLQRTIAESRWTDLLREQRRRAKSAVGDDATSEAAEALEQARRSLLEKTGLDPSLTDEGLTYVVGRIHEWQTAARSVSVAEESLVDAREHQERMLEQFNASASAYEAGYPESGDSPTDAAAAAKVVSRLRGADTAYREAAGELKQARESVARITAELEKYEKQTAALFERAGLEAGDVQGLRELCRRKDAYDEARSAHDEAVGAEKARLASVRDHARFDEADLERSLQSVNDEIERLSDEADRVEKLTEDIRSIRQDVARAENSHELELARSELDDALLALDDERMGHIRSLAGAMLTEYVSEQTYEQQLPAVFKRARSIFSRVTSGRYELRFRDSSFTAFDTIIAREHDLSELSTGTRVQLLLSVRIAFIEEQERGVRLPIVLDETLANSDDDRAEAIVRTVLRICRTGRQVFYLTARDDEVMQWKAVSDALGDVDLRIVPLKASGQPARFADVKLGLQSGSGNGTVPAFARSIPKPFGLNHDEYGSKLDVAPWSPYAPTGALHLWYIVEDVDILHRLLEAGYERWGQLQGLIRDGNPAVVDLERVEIDRIRNRAEAVAAWKQAWSVGRGRPVDADVLARSGAVSDKFLEEVAALADSLAGDGAATVEALRTGAVSGFYEKKMNELEDWLIENDYIDESGTLTADEIWSSTVRAVSDQMTDSGMTIADLKQLIGRVTGIGTTPSRTEEPSAE